MSELQLHRLSLKELHRSLELRGIEIGYTSLSDLIKQDDIAEQLNVGGGRNRREFLPGTVDVLAEFIPEYRKADGTLIQASRLLRAFLSRRASSPGQDLIPLPVPEKDQTLEPARAARIQGIASTDVVFTASEAADFLRVSVRQLRRSVKPSFRLGKSARGDRWYKSDLLSL